MRSQRHESGMGQCGLKVQVVILLLAAAPNVEAQFAHRSSVLDSSGALSNGGSFTNISASGQPGGIGTSAGGPFVNQAGFLSTFSLKPALDTDSDGLANELDQDNDNDGLADGSEITGASFSPTSPTLVHLADTDDDGVLDGAEAVAGTDPNNPNALLKLVAISNAGPSRAVAWLARGNNQKIYIVRSSAALTGPFHAVVFSNTVAGGSAPWFAVTSAVTHTSASNALFYAVEVVP